MPNGHERKRRAIYLALGSLHELPHAEAQEHDEAAERLRREIEIDDDAPTMAPEDGEQ